MTLYEYITQELTQEQFNRLVRVGLVSSSIPLYKSIYEFHVANGCRREKTQQHFHMPSSTIGYALRIMKKQI